MSSINIIFQYITPIDWKCMFERLFNKLSDLPVAGAANDIAASGMVGNIELILI